jgi:hypothetical protein
MSLLSLDLLARMSVTTSAWLIWLSRKSGGLMTGKKSSGLLFVGGTEFEMFFPAFIKKELKALEMSAGSVSILSFTLIFSTFSFEEDLFKASLYKFPCFFGVFFGFF